MQPNTGQTLEQWTKIVIEIWEEKILQLGITDTFSLVRSFYSHIMSSAGGDASKIEFAFNFYGMMVDMGVGKGTKLADRDSSIRVKKQWYSKTFLKQVGILARIMAEKYAKAGAITIAENIFDNALKSTSKSV